MSGTAAVASRAAGGFRSRVIAAFAPPDLPPRSKRAFRFHMAYILLDALCAGIISNVPVMAVKAMGATDKQIQLPQAMASAGFFASAVLGTAMAGRSKKPFVLVPGLAAAFSMLGMAWLSSPLWFLAAAGMVSIFEFSLRPAIPSILRSIYPENCRAHVAGVLRQYASVVFLVSVLFFSWLLSLGSADVLPVIRFELTLAGFVSLAAYACFRQLPDSADGDSEDAADTGGPWTFGKDLLVPLRDARFRRYLAIFFLFATSNLFYQGIVPVFFARDLGLGYVSSTVLIFIVPAISAFLFGGRLAAWFDRTPIWVSYGAVALLWGLDPVLLAVAPFSWPAVWAARIIRGPSTVGSIVLTYYTGVHSFAAPGRATSCYMAVQFLVNGVARFTGPASSALLSEWLSHRMILFVGGAGVLTASLLFFLHGKRTSSSDGAS